MNVVDFSTQGLEIYPKMTKDFILSKVDDIVIYQYYLGVIKTGQFPNPFRKDIHPSFSFKYTNNRLTWKDYATGEKGDCFNFVQKYFNISFAEALEKIGIDLNLKKGIYKINPIQKKEIENIKNSFKEEVFYQIEIRPFNKEELAWWNQYYITEKELLENDIYGINKLWKNGRKIYLNPSLHFGYYFPEEEKWKIYSPEDKRFKWLGNISTYYIEGLNQEFDYSKPILITKSRKDFITLKKFYCNVVNTQNENESSIPLEKDEFFNKFPSKLCWFDSDAPGKEANKKLNKRGYSWINIPNNYYEELGLKDPSDIIKYFGLEKGREIICKELYNKGLICKT